MALVNLIAQYTPGNSGGVQHRETHHRGGIVITRTPQFFDDIDETPAADIAADVEVASMDGDSAEAATLRTTLTTAISSIATVVTNVGTDAAAASGTALVAEALRDLEAAKAKLTALKAAIPA